MANYIALIHKDAGSEYGVLFPDLPGCISVGATLDEARANAEEALALHVEGMVEDGEPVPAPSTLQEVMAHAENRDGAVIVVPLKSTASKVVRVNVTMPENVLAEIDAFAEAHGFTRSGLLVQGAKRVMEAEAA
jgi:predicted RNase H-like HicB family nuclease